MNPQALSTFVAIVRHGSFSAAARTLGYTQSAVSQQVAALESDLGTTLLERRPLALTATGRRLLEHAGPLLVRLEAARSDIAAMSSSPTAARVVLGVSPLAMSPRLAERLAAMRAGWPRLTMTVRLLDAQSIPVEVAKGAVDLGLSDGVTAPADRLHLPDLGPLLVTAVAEQALAVVLPGKHPLAGRTGLDLTDLTDAGWIDAPGCAIPLARLRALVASDGYRPSLRYEGSDVQGLIALARAGHGLTLLPQSVLDGMPRSLAIPLVSPPLVHRVELIHRNHLSAPAQALAADLAMLASGHTREV